ncbi:MAG: hypothetical protein JW818_02215 [Pirellulales bacterium]|nr:hypothetical protein [Pirellulales bacterium]
MRHFLRAMVIGLLVVSGFASQARAEHYAVLFASGPNAAENMTSFYYDTLAMYNVLVHEWNYLPENVYVLAADGLDPAVDRADGANSDWSSLDPASTVLSSTPANLATTLQSLPAGPRDTFIFWALSHGSGDEGNLADHSEEEFWGWGASIPDEDFPTATYLGSVQTGRQAYIFGNCYSGGILEELAFPTGEIRFGCAASNHYEPAIYNPVVPPGDFCMAFAQGISIGGTDTDDLFTYALNNTPQALTGGEGAPYVDGFQHPWMRGDNFDLSLAQWMGYQNGSWTDPDNWSDGREPDLDRYVRIVGTTNTPAVDGLTDTIRQLKLCPSTELYVANGGELNVTEDVENNAGRILIAEGTMNVGTDLFNNDPSSVIEIGPAGRLNTGTLENVGAVEVAGRCDVTGETSITGSLRVHHGGLFLSYDNVDLAPNATLNIEDTSSQVTVGYDLVANGTITMADSTVLHVDNMFRAGDGGQTGAAQLNLSAAMVSVANQMKLGITDNATMIATQSTLSVGSLVSVGEGSGASLILRGGSLSAQYLHVGNGSGSNGYLSLEAVAGDGPKIKIGGASPTVVVGYDSFGQVMQYGGVITRIDPDGENPDPIYPTVILGRNSESMGLYRLQHGEIHAHDFEIGRAGDGSLNQIQSQITAEHWFSLAVEPGSTGKYEFQGGSLLAQHLRLGVEGIATINQSQGLADIGGELRFGVLASGEGTYNLRGGTLHADTIANGPGQGILNVDGGTLSLTGSTLEVEQLAVGSSNGTVGQLELTGKTCTVNTLTVGGEGQGTFTKNGGSFTATNRILVGDDQQGTLRQTAGDLNATMLYVGYQSQGTGQVALDGGSLTVSTNLTIGYLGDQNEFVQKIGTTVTANSLCVGCYSTDNQYIQEGGQLTATAALGIALSSGSQGMFVLHNGNLASGTTIVGQEGTGYFFQLGGTHSLSGDLWLAEAAGSTGRYYFGNASATGILQEASPGLGLDLIVRSLGATGASAMFRGWGNVQLTGELSNNGCVVAQGYGSQRTLDLSHFTSIVQSDSLGIIQGDGSQAGWYATEQGKLVLPAVPVATGDVTVNWGETAGDLEIDLVNSAQIKLANVTTGGTLSIALLATDRTEAPSVPSGSLLTVWDITPSAGLAFDTADLIFRYDDALAASLGILDADLRIYQHTGGMWVDVTSALDATHHWLQADGVDGFSCFAVGAGVMLPGPGDANSDGQVDAADAAALAAHWLQTGAEWDDGDFNGDGRVDDLDASILAAHWLVGTEGNPAVPEPSMFILLLGLLVTLWRPWRHVLH